MERADAIQEAHRLVTAEGWTYARASAATGVPCATLEKRGAREGWTDQRNTSSSYAATIRALKVLLLQQLMDAAADSKITGDELIKRVGAWKAAEAAFPEHRYTEKGDPKARLSAGAELLELVVEVLTEVDRVALAALRPHIARIAQAWEARCAISA